MVKTVKTVCHMNTLGTVLSGFLKLCGFLKVDPIKTEILKGLLNPKQPTKFLKITLPEDNPCIASFKTFSQKQRI